MARTSITITLELDRTLDGTVSSPSGSARLADGTSRKFQGWLGLAETIDLLARTPTKVNSNDTSKAGEKP